MSDREDKYHIISLIWGIKKKEANKETSSQIENRLVVVRSRKREMGKISEGGQKIQTSSYKIT